MILLDTHVWIWLLSSPAKIPSATRELIETDPLIAISSVSCWEAAMLCSKKRLQLPLPLDQWIQRTLEADNFEIIPLGLEAAIMAGGETVNWPHADPSDRMIVSTAIDLDIPLVTADRKIHLIEGFTSIWEKNYE